MTAFPYSTPIACLLSQGEDCLVKADFTQALDVFEQALALAQQTQNGQAEVLALQRLAFIHLEQGQADLSLASMEQALAIALEQHNVHALYGCHRQLAQTHKATQNFEAALQHLETAESMRPNLPELKLHPALQYAEVPPATPEVSTSLELDYQALLGPMLFRHIIEQAHIGVAIFQESHIVFSNQCLRQWLGYPGQTNPTLDLNDIFSPSDAWSVLKCQRQVLLQTQGFCQCDKPLRCSNGQVIEVEFNASKITFNHRPAVLTLMRNITKRKQMEQHLQMSEARYRSLFNHVPIGLCRFSPEGDLLDANPALMKMFGGRDRDSFLASNPLAQSVASQSAWQSCLQQTGPLKRWEVELVRQDGRPLWIRVDAQAVTDANGLVLYYEGAIEDMTEIRVAQIALEELAVRDSLTHAYNRRHFFELAKREIARASRFSRPMTLLLIDIDHFKIINDTYGHLVGDQVLRDVVLRLRDNLRESDILARYGGEEFIVLMPETSKVQAWNGAERLRQIVAEQPFVATARSLMVTVSVGVATWNTTATMQEPTLEDLINQADQALYRAKRMGRNQTQTSSCAPFGITPPTLS
jgi:diguanylate cyclase (GGDEF)-like protein/PAS domain S-box-containing protein